MRMFFQLKQQLLKNICNRYMRWQCSQLSSVKVYRNKYQVLGYDASVVCAYVVCAYVCRLDPRVAHCAIGAIPVDFSKTIDHLQLLKFVNEVVEMTFPRTLIIMNRMIFAFAECGGRGGKGDEMLIKFISMKEAGISPDLVTYNTLINNLKECCTIDLCLMCWRELGEKDIQPDLRMYSSMIDSLGRSGMLRKL